jgi:hypothetical protein
MTCFFELGCILLGIKNKQTALLHWRWFQAACYDDLLSVQVFFLM